MTKWQPFCKPVKKWTKCLGFKWLFTKWLSFCHVYDDSLLALAPGLTASKRWLSTRTVARRWRVCLVARLSIRCQLFAPD